MGAGASPAPSVVGKVRRILEALAEAGGQVGLAELTRRTGLAKATVHRVAGDLAEWGVVEHVDGGFRLGPRLFELGQRVPAHRTLRDAALPFLEDVYTTIRETVHLGVLDGLDVLYIERILGRQSSPTPSTVAGRYPLYCTATGKCLLAWSPPGLVERVVEHGLAARTRHTVTVPSVLQDQLAQVRARGWAAELEELKLGFGSVAAPVFGPRGVLLGAMSATSTTGRLDVDRFVPSIRTAALGLSRQLGGAQSLGG